ncbi:MAG: ATP-binding protein [Novosphingobium sp.]
MNWFRNVFRRDRAEDPFESLPAFQPLPMFQALAPLSPVVPHSSLQAMPQRKPASTNTLPRFLNPGNELGGFETEGAGGARNRVRNAFSPSLPITNPRLLAGRGEALQTLIRAIEDLRLHVIIYGERGIGKTSLLQILRQLAEEAKYQVVYHSCGEDARFPEMFRAIASEIPLLYYHGFNAASEDMRKGGSLGSLLPAGDFNVSQLSDTFAQLSNTRVLIMLDEFDRSPPGLFRRNIAQLIKNLSDRSVRVQLVISGVAGNLADLIEHIPSIRRNILGYRVPELAPGEVRQMVTIGEEISGLIFDPDASERIIAMANGSPYLASLLSQYSSFGALNREGQIVTPIDVQHAVEQVSGELRSRISEPALEGADHAIDDGWGETLHALANRSMHAMGALDAEKIDESFSGQSFPEVAEEFVTRYKLLVPAPEERADRYRFREEGIGSYLWLRLSPPLVAAAEVD